MTALPYVEGGFHALISDSPWKYQDTGSRASPDYADRSMTVSELCAMPIAALMADDALAVTWVTSSHCDLEPVGGRLIDGISAGVRVLHAWGFRYRAMGVWVKTKKPDSIAELLAEPMAPLELLHASTSRGMGHYVRHAHEIFLIGRRGRFSIPTEHRDSSVFFAPRPPKRPGQRRAHSTKPDFLHRWIDRFVSGPRLELFSREQRDGWSAYGDEL